MAVKDKYYELDKYMSKKIKEEMIENGITEYPTECQDCKGGGCEHCNDSGEIWYQV
jgi:hypothetical protein